MMEIKTVFSAKRKTLCLKIDREGAVTVTAPLFTSEKVIREFVKKHEDWIYKNVSKMKQKNLKYVNADTDALRAAAKEYIPPRVRYFSEITGLSPTGVRITSARGRFGSCSGKNSLCFSLYLMLYPKEAVDYVIVHELAHIKEKNHSPRFYKIIEKYLPDYKSREKLLKTWL